MLGLTGLFFAAFLAATIVPAQSEAVLVGLILAGDHTVGALLFVATVGNVGGSLVNWIIGRYLGRLFGHPEPPPLNRSTAMFRKRRTMNGKQTTKARRDRYKVTSS